ncbi:MAG: protein kinase [Candidatus Obscuribacterales bacterium]|nr:protein kinase [Cyanobacteria bacterium HKST-UBA01]MCB9471037.1 protein kinase [Candidatus Obscuribacterales bacterium]
MKMSVQTKPAVQAKKPIRILLVEDQEVLRLGIKLSFHDSPDLQIVGEAADGPTAVTMAEELQPDLILMDIGLPEFDGIVATRRIKAETGSKILILSSHGEDECLYPSLEAGADGYCLKDISKDSLLSAIRAVAGGGTWLDDSIARRVLKAVKSVDPQSTSQNYILTEPERRILNLIMEGKSAELIAQELEMSLSDVHNHTKVVLQKVSIKDRIPALEDSDPARSHRRITYEHELARRCRHCYKKLPLSEESCPYDGQEAILDERIGSIYAERYEILSLIGSGTGGAVYKARHKFMGKMVAIKIMHPEQMNNIDLIQRFRQEAATVSILKHENIVSVTDFGLTESGDAFMIMEYCDGVGLDTILNEHGYLRAQLAVPIFRQICTGMAEAHKNGILHRDLKPSNVLISKFGSSSMRVQIADFGTAKVLSNQGGLGAPVVETKIGQIFGTPLYMSPEQCQGKNLSKAADIYSLGCLMYQTLTGQPPINGDDYVDVMYKHVNCEPTNIAQTEASGDVPAFLQGIVMKAIRKDPGMRYQSMEELKSYLDGIPI